MNEFEDEVDKMVDRLNTDQAARDATQERIADALEEIASVLHSIACTYEERGRSHEDPIWVRGCVETYKE